VPERNRWSVVVGLGLVVFMATLDATAVAIALPAIERGYGVTTTVTEWVVLGYLLPLIAVSLPAGRWLDGVGLRGAHVFATAGFGLSSLAAGLAPGIGWLVAARAVQGTSAGILFALGPMIATRVVRPEARGRAVGVITSLGPLGAVSGPVLGGLIVDGLGWPWIFYLNLPVCLAVILIGWAGLSPDRPLVPPGRTLLAEAVVLGAALVAGMLALSLAAGRHPAWLLLALAAVPPLIVWARMEGSRGTRALIRAPGVAGPLVTVMLISMAAAAVEFTVSFHLQRVAGLGPSAAGMTLLAFPAGMVPAGLLAGLLVDRWSAAGTARLGALVLAAGLALLVPLDATWSPAEVLWRLGIAGCGVGLTNGPAVTLVMTRAAGDLLGTAGAAQSLARQLGFAVAPALVTTVWAGYGYAPAGLRAAMLPVTAAAVLALVALARSRTARPAEDDLAARPSAADA
jgi:MFS family permease